MPKAAIEFERTLEAPFGEVKAKDFLAAVAQARLGAEDLYVIADKKKYELWVEEGRLDKIPVRVIIEKLRGEKKKIELEPMIDFTQRINPAMYERLVEDVARRLEARLGGGR